MPVVTITADPKLRVSVTRQPEGLRVRVDVLGADPERPAAGTDDSRGCQRSL